MLYNQRSNKQLNFLIALIIVIEKVVAWHRNQAEKPGATETGLEIWEKRGEK